MEQEKKMPEFIRKQQELWQRIAERAEERRKSDSAEPMRKAKFVFPAKSKKTTSGVPGIFRRDPCDCEEKKRRREEYVKSKAREEQG